jgi:hypothetical protein
VTVGLLSEADPDREHNMVAVNADARSYASPALHCQR